MSSETIYRQQKKVFVLGAGASHGAREPHPPLGRDLHSYVLKYLKMAWLELRLLETGYGSITEDARVKLRDYLDKAQSYESLVSSLQGSKQVELIEKLNLLMASALTPPINDDPRTDNAFIEKMDVYDQFLSKNFSANLLFPNMWNRTITVRPAPDSER